MGENKYEIFVGTNGDIDEFVAEVTGRENAFLLADALMQKYRNEPGMTVTVIRKESGNVEDDRT